MENEVQVYRKPLTAADIKAQVQLIQEVMKAVMEKGVHYGIIPGTPKPTLYKPGSEKLLSTFRIGVEPDSEDLSTIDEVRYRVKAKGFSQTTGEILGVGIGECSSNEEKYRWRKPVCDEEFNETPEDQKRIAWKKQDGKPYQQTQVRTKPADVANTILKMAKKRAQIDLTLTVTAASDIFDQDLEDMDEATRESVVNGEKEKPPIAAPQKKGEQSAPKDQAAPVNSLHGVYIEDITIKEGTKNGKPWKLYGIKAGGVFYNTFSDTFYATAEQAKENGVPVRIGFNATTRGNDITSLTLDIPEDREPGAEG